MGSKTYISGLCLAATLLGANAIELELPGREPTLKWDRKKQTFSAAIDSLPLKAALAKVSTATGWKVYLDPAAERIVSVEFRDRSSSDALRMMLGGLNFAVVPQAGGPSKLLVFRNSAKDATVAIEAAKDKERGQDWLKNEIIVSLKRGSKISIEELAKQLGAKIVGRDDRLRTYRLRFDSDEASEAARGQLASNNELRVDDNFAVRPPDTREDPAQSRAPNFDLKPSANADGAYTKVAVIDTAVQPLDEAKSKFLLPQINVAGEPDPQALKSSTPLHGTSMVETLLGSMATFSGGEVDESSIRIRPINVYGSGESTSSYEVTVGFYYAVTDGADVISMSLGGDGDSPLLDNLIGQARAQGVEVFAAAGNSPTTDPTFPAANPNVYAVTASDRNGSVAPYANRGDFIDLIASGTSYINYGGANFRISGTSPATATVAGAAAMYRSTGHSVVETDAMLQQTFGFRRR